MATLIDNLYDIPKPENDQTGYDFDGINIIYLKNDNTHLRGFEPNYTLYHNRNIYKFNTLGVFYKYTVMGDEIPYNFKEKEQESKELTYTILQPIIDIQPKPPKYANFQWLFNITYGRRFQ